LHGVLVEFFPVLHGCLGAIPFHNLITDYLLACPSTSADVRRIGDKLPEFVRNWPHPGASALSQLAGIELAIVDALDCADAKALSLSDLAAVPQTAWPSVKLRLHPSVSVHDCDLDFVALKGAAEEGKPLGAEAQGSATNRAFLVWRKGLSVLHRELDAGEGAAVSAALRGDNFEGVCAAAAATQSGFQAEHAAQMVARWLSDGLIAGVGDPCRGDS
jgi:hypothetical protein